MRLSVEENFPQNKDMATNSLQSLIQKIEIDDSELKK